MIKKNPTLFNINRAKVYLFSLTDYGNYNWTHLTHAIKYKINVHKLDKLSGGGIYNLMSTIYNTLRKSQQPQQPQSPQSPNRKNKTRQHAETSETSETSEITMCFINVHLDTDEGKKIQHSELRYLLYDKINTNEFFEDVDMIYIGGDFNLQTDEIANVILDDQFYEKVYQLHKPPQLPKYVYSHINKKYVFDIMLNNVITRNRFHYVPNDKFNGVGLDNLIMLSNSLLTPSEKNNIKIYVGHNSGSGDINTEFDENSLDKSIENSKDFITKLTNSNISKTSAEVFQEVSKKAKLKSNIDKLLDPNATPKPLNTDYSKLRKIIYSDHSPVMYRIPIDILKKRSSSLNQEYQSGLDSHIVTSKFKYNGSNVIYKFNVKDVNDLYEYFTPNMKKNLARSKNIDSI